MEFYGQIAQNFGAFVIILTVIGIIISIFTDWLSPAKAFLFAAIILILTGVIQINELLISFSNAQIITIFLLIFLTVGIRENINVNQLFDRVFPGSMSPSMFLLKLSTVVAFFSAFMNNTPVVAMLTSNVQQWAKLRKMAPSKFLIPLSFAAILGGMITVIGTSTNLVLQGLITSSSELELGIADFAVVGSGVCLTGILFLAIFATRLLPERSIALKAFAENKGEYIHEVELEKNNNLVGKTVAEAGFRNLQGIYLVEIARGNELLTPVAPDTVLEKDDHLYFAGDTEILVEFVRKKNGLMLSSAEKLQKVGEGNIVEVVVAANSELAGVQVKDSNFREKYNASILGIHRNGERMSGKVGHLKLRSGDLLLLLTGNDFENRIEKDKNLFLLGKLKKAFSAPKSKFPWVYRSLQLLTIIGLLTGYLSFLLSLMLSLFLVVLFKYLSIEEIKRNFNLDLLIVLACSLTIGKAFIDSGAADLVSNEFLAILPQGSPRIVLLEVFLFTVLLTSLITNVAAVSIAFPIAYAIAHQLNMDGTAFYLTIAFGASAAFLTPMAYQTNMMVYGPGGYKSKDFLRIGLPMLAVYSISSLFMIYWWFEI